jgi:hypothetical protein
MNFQCNTLSKAPLGTIMVEQEARQEISPDFPMNSSARVCADGLLFLTGKICRFSGRE